MKVCFFVHVIFMTYVGRVMNEQELSKLSRRELLELLLAEEKELQSVREQLEEKTTELQSRKIQKELAGTLAEACLQVNGFFEAAEKAAQQYQENMRLQCEETKAKCKELEERTIHKCRWIEAETKRRAKEYLLSIQKKASVSNVYRVSEKEAENE